MQILNSVPLRNGGSTVKEQIQLWYFFGVAYPLMESTSSILVVLIWR
jgi:hypothetical protein